ncbi:MAG TPA: hypothetical protein VFG05_07480 [Methylocella sp.]|nr:hypothetical protein [Methylocella sp.]
MQLDDPVAVRLTVYNGSWTARSPAFLGAAVSNSDDDKKITVALWPDIYGVVFMGIDSASSAIARADYDPV